jgi:hypothetical protein
LARLGVGDGTLAIEAPSALGEVTIELRDHHFVKIGALVVQVGAGRTTAKLPDVAGVESLLVRAGAFTGRVDLNLDGIGSREFGGATPVKP